MSKKEGLYTFWGGTTTNEKLGQELEGADTSTARELLPNLNIQIYVN